MTPVCRICPGVWLIGYTQWHSIGEMDFPFPRRYQRQKAPRLGVGFGVHFFTVLRFLSCLNLYKSCVCCCCLWVHMGISSVVSERCCLLEVIYPPDSYKLSTSCCAQISELWGEGFDEDKPRRTEWFRVFHSLHIDILMVTTSLLDLLLDYTSFSLLFWGLFKIMKSLHQRKTI